MLLMTLYPRPFALTLLLSVYAAASSPLHSSGPLANLNVVVLDAAARPIVGARLTIGAEVRRTDGGGFVNFAVPGPVLVDVVAPGYRPKRVDLPPGDHRVHLELAARRPGAIACGAAAFESCRVGRTHAARGRIQRTTVSSARAPLRHAQLIGEPVRISETTWPVIATRVKSQPLWPEPNHIRAGAGVSSPSRAVSDSAR